MLVQNVEIQNIECFRWLERRIIISAKVETLNDVAAHVLVNATDGRKVEIALGNITNFRGWWYKTSRIWDFDWIICIKKRRDQHIWVKKVDFWSTTLISNWRVWYFEVRNVESTHWPQNSFYIVFLIIRQSDQNHGFILTFQPYTRFDNSYFDNLYANRIDCIKLWVKILI